MTGPATSAEPRAAKTPGRYRKVEVRTWGDERFRALSPIPPCGQGLWLYLITGPRTGPIPGLFSAGRAAMAEDLDWPLEAFDEAFQEAFAQGMVKADFKARVVWIPRAVIHNLPTSPNVVKNWGAEFDLIPECDLKREAFEALKVSIHAAGEAFGKAFDESFRKPSAKPLAKTSGNQEQEQELKEIHPPPLRGDPPAVAVRVNGHSDSVRAGEDVKLAELVAEGVEAKAASDWLRCRKVKRAPLTRTAWAAVKREAAGIGWTPAQAVKHAAENAWTGFKAEWLQRSSGHGAQVETTYQRTQRERMAQFAPGVAARAPGTSPPSEIFDMEPNHGPPHALG